MASPEYAHIRHRRISIHKQRTAEAWALPEYSRALTEPGSDGLTPRRGRKAASVQSWAWASGVGDGDRRSATACDEPSDGYLRPPLPGARRRMSHLPGGMIGDVFFSGVPKVDSLHVPTGDIAHTPHAGPQPESRAIGVSPKPGGGPGPIPLLAASEEEMPAGFGTFAPDDASAAGVAPQGATKWQTVFNVLNLYVGLGLLSQGYSLAKGGWAASILILASAWIFLWTGKLIVRCYASMRDGEDSYPDLGAAAFACVASAAGRDPVPYQRAGRNLVTCVCILEFLGATGMAIIIYWENAMPFFQVPPDRAPLADRAVVAALLTLLLIPSVCIETFSDISIISFFGFTTSVLILASVCAVYFSSLSHDQWREEHAGPPYHYGERSWVKWDTLPMAGGIILLTFCGHACLPSFKKSMADADRDFEPMMDISFTFILSINLVLAVIGYLTFGEGSRTLITSNIRSATSTDVVWQHALMLFLQGFVAFKAYCMFVPCVAVMVEMLEDFHPLPPVHQLFHLRLRRCFSTCVIASLAFMLQNYLDTLEALIGGVCSLATSLIFPVLFFYLLNSRTAMSAWRRRLYVAIIALSVVAMVLVVTSSVADVLKRAYAPHPARHKY